MWRYLFGTVALLTAVFSPPSPALPAIDEAYVKPDDKKSWGELLADFIGHRGFGKSYALVIGISNFDHFSPLPTANDPVRIREFLIHQAGFDYVHVLTDEMATKARIDELMVDVIPRMIHENDQFLFYWSGHGTQRPNELGGQTGYLPLSSSPRDRYGTMISMSDILRWDEVLAAKQALFLLDACFSGLAGSVNQSGHRDLQIDQLDKPAHHLVSAGTGEEQTIAGDRWGGSIFADAVLRAMQGEADAETSYPRDGVVSLSELIGYVKARVAIEAPAAHWNTSITPQLRDLRKNAGEFFFLTNERKLARLNSDGARHPTRFEYGIPVVVMGDAPLPQDARTTAWTEAKKRDTFATYEDFLDDYCPSDREQFCTEAREALKEQALKVPGGMTDCDRYAASPTDYRRVTSGVEWDDLDTQLALQACKRAAIDTRNPRLMYQYGRVLDKEGEHEEARAWFVSAAEKGYPAAHVDLAVLYAVGEGVRKDYAKALEWLKKAAEHYNDSSAQIMLGKIYRDGLFGKEDPEQAHHWFQRAAEQGNPEAQLALGLLYEEGQDFGQAEQWYERAAAQGILEAERRLKELPDG
jgi:tetratricopeptide (TPR) repeat protein